MKGGALIDVCDVTREQSFSALCKEALSAPVSAPDGESAAPARKRKLWQMLTATDEVEIIDDKEDGRK